MRKILLLKYLNGETTQSETDAVIAWIDKSRENKEYFLVLKNLWVSQHLPNTKVVGEELAQFMEELHDEGDVLTTQNRRHTFYKVVAMVASVAAVVAMVFIVTRPSVATLEEKIKSGYIRVALSEIPSEYKHTIYTEKGVKGFVTLPDGSKVWLNSETKISYPDKFIGNTREVEMAGEAYFIVVKDSLQPMVVNTQRGFSVKVLGTEFNLKSYTNEPDASATLFSGKIDLIYKNNTTDKERITEVALHTTAVISNDQIKMIHPKEMVTVSAWKEGRLIFESAKLDEVIRTLERWHGIEFAVQQPGILDYTITATFKSESITQIMDMIKFCIPIDYKINANTVQIFPR